MTHYSASCCLRTHADSPAVTGGYHPKNQIRNAVSHALKSHAFTNKYDLHGTIVGYGSNGVVLGATDTSSTQNVAVKLIWKPQAPTKKRKHEDITKSREILVLEHLYDEFVPGIIDIIDHWQDSKLAYLVTDLVSHAWLPAPSTTITICNTPFVVTTGRSDLHSWSLAVRASIYNLQGHTYIPYAPIQSILRQCATTLSCCHALGYIHGDLKLENILAREGGAVSRPGIPVLSLADFGHARRVGETLASYGTLGLCAPELMRGSPFCGVVDGRGCDVFALGLVFAGLLSEAGRVERMEGGYWDLMRASSGDYPFGGEFVQELEGGALALLQGMCKVDPRERLTMDEVLKHPWLA
ncbi:kinase-like domain-containing protein [Chytriomyces sp. MP71]|nr:kinase-like domain-containing protein [Chytriomyces sp. MP71]